MAFDPQKVGEKMVAVGKKQVDTGNNLRDVATHMRTVAGVLTSNGNFAQSLEKIETGTRSVRTVLGIVVNAFRAVETNLRAIAIPALDVDSRSLDFPVVGRVRFVTGIALSSVRPFLTPAASIGAVADELNNVREALFTIADGVDALYDNLPQIRTGVMQGASEAQAAGDTLIDAGTVMQEAGTLMQA